MSRIGKAPIPLPKGVTASVVEGSVKVQGPKGALSQSVVENVSVAVEGGNILVSRKDDSRQSRSNHGLMRALLKNNVTGVATGWERRLELQGVGFKSEVKAGKLIMALGFSHPVEFPIPAGITIDVDKTGKLFVRGVDRQQVGQVAAVIRGFRPPDHYKGKGVRYEGESVRIKEGKSSK